MKLLKPESCRWESGGGNENTLTALGDAFADISSDRGSTPLASTKLIIKMAIHTQLPKKVK